MGSWDRKFRRRPGREPLAEPGNEKTVELFLGDLIRPDRAHAPGFPGTWVPGGFGEDPGEFVDLEQSTPYFLIQSKAV